MWISASGDGRSGGGVVLRAVAAQLLDEVRDAAERGASYRALGQGFRARRFAGREFHVDAWPPERLDHTVLGVERPAFRGPRGALTGQCHSPENGESP